MNKIEKNKVDPADQDVFIKGLRRQRWARASDNQPASPTALAQQARREQRERLEQDQIEQARSSSYYWWWLFLRESEEFQRARLHRNADTKVLEVARDFGNIQQRDFGDWWLRRGVDLFKQTQPIPRVLEMMVTESVPLPRDGKTHLYLKIPLTIRRSTVLRQINELLDPHYRDQPQGRLNVFAHSTARYDINRGSKLRQRTLEQIYMVWTQRNANPEEPWWQLGTRLKISPAFINHAHTPKAVTVNNNRLMTLNVQRLYRKAKNIIYWAARGDFPCIKTPPQPPVKAGSRTAGKVRRPVKGR
jgi:hypothetical protein